MTINESAPAIPTRAPTTKESHLCRSEYSINGRLALKLAERGWFVFPCREKPCSYKKGEETITRKEKEPYTPKGKNDATTDQAQVKTWWKRWPEALVGVYCEHSGIFALDLDVKNGKNGLESLQGLISRFAGGGSTRLWSCSIYPQWG
jgi:hypothetical protein